MQELKKADWFHADGFPVTVERREPQVPFGLHTHDFCEIVVITGGTGVHVAGSDQYQLTVGDAFVIGGDIPHDYLYIDDLRLINILFDPQDLLMDWLDLPQLPGYHALFKLEPAFRKQHQFSSRLRLSPVELAQASNLIEHLGSELESRQPGFEVMAMTFFYQIVAYLSRCYSRSQDSGGKALLEIASTISHLERNYCEPIALDDLVSMSGMSRRNFLRIFEATMGMPPIKYLINLRICRACELLQNDELTIAQIASTVGFEDSNYFSRQFRKIIGTSPSLYRSRRLQPSP